MYLRRIVWRIVCQLTLRAVAQSTRSTKMIRAILLGFSLVVITICIHALGTTLWMRKIIRNYTGHDGLLKPHEIW